MQNTYTTTIYGQPFSKANSRRLVKRGNRTISIKSQKALDYQEDALLQLKKYKGEPLTGDLCIECTIYYPDDRQDLDASLVFDILQKGAIIQNDRQLKEMHLYREVDKTNPRSEISIRSRNA